MAEQDDSAIKDRLSRVEKAQDRLDTTLASQTNTVILWTERTDVLRKRVEESDARAVESAKNIAASVDGLGTRLSNQLGGIDQRVAANSARVVTLEQVVEGLGKRVTTLEISKVSVSWFTGARAIFLFVVGAAVAFSTIYVALHTAHAIP